MYKYQVERNTYIYIYTYTIVVVGSHFRACRFATACVLMLDVVPMLFRINQLKGVPLV